MSEEAKEEEAIVFVVLIDYGLISEITLLQYTYSVRMTVGTFVISVLLSVR